MTGGFANEPEAVRSAAGRFRTCGEGLERAFGELRATLTSLGDICGDDDQGRQFASGYEPAAADAERAVERSVGALRSVASALDRSAQDYRGVDDAARESLGGAGL